MSRHEPPPSPDESIGDALLLAVGNALPLPCVVALPADGRILFANHALGTLLGVEARYLVGDRLDRLFFDEARAGNLRAMMTGGQPPSAQLPVVLRGQGKGPQVGQPVAASLCPASVSLGADALAVLFFIPLAGRNDSTLPSALAALEQGLPQRSDTDGCLKQLRAALTRSP